MSTLLLNQNTIRLDIEPTTFRAYSPAVFGGKSGKLTLEVSPEGFRLLNKKGKGVSVVAWHELEDLRNTIRHKGHFTYRGKLFLATGTTIMRIRIGVEPNERERLAQIFDQLPRDLSGHKCGKCGGSMIDNVCKTCGETFTGQQRRKGIRMLTIGSFVLMLGIVLTYATYNATSGTVFVFYGAILVGAGLVIGGLVGLIFGTRV